MESNFDMEAMRQQMAILKQKLDHQEIVNEQIIRKSMKRNVSSITRRYYALIVLGLLMIPYGYWVFVKLTNFSVAFWIGTCVMMLICAAATYYNGKDLNDKHLMRKDLVEVRTKVARAKKFDSQWLLIGIPMFILWFIWFCYEAVKQYGPLSENTFIYSGLVGLVLGLILGLRIHTKTQNDYQEIIDQIEDLTK